MCMRGALVRSSCRIKRNPPPCVIAAFLARPCYEGGSVILQRGLRAFEMGLWPKGTARRRSAGTDDAGICIPLALLF